MADIQTKLFRKLRETLAKLEGEEDDGPDARNDTVATGRRPAPGGPELAATRHGGAVADMQSTLLRKLRETIARVERDASDGPDARDEKIATLERKLEAERENAAALRKTIDEQCFQIETLDRSYAKQLDDTRQRAKKAEEALANEKARACELEATMTKLTHERDEVRKELDYVTRRERVSLSFGPSATPNTRQDRSFAPVPDPDEGLSIDEMLAEANVVDPKDQANRRRPSGHSDAPVSTEDENPLEDMLSPDLVFTGKDAD